MTGLSVTTAFTLLFLVCLGRECWAQVDLTLEEEQKGSDVVLAVVAKIEASGVFPSDKRLLRRMAYVESKDGNDSDTYPPPSKDSYYGGIWQVDLEAFQRTQNTKMYPVLIELHSEIAQKFFDGNATIEWTSVQWTALQKPLYSGLAARLFLSTINDSIPAASNVSGQADYWNRHYKKGKGDVGTFSTDVYALQDIEICEVFFDLIFVLDSSGSVGEDNYNQTLVFVYTFVSQLAIGPDANQVGVIIFGSQEEIVFNLSTYSNKTNLLQAITEIPYLRGSTNTGDALRTMADVGFSTEAGARTDDNTIFRIGIVLTDGQSNRGEPLVNVTAHVHGISPPILVYAIGVGGYDLDELRIIASEPGFIDLLQSFDANLFQESQEERIYELCFKASVPAEAGGAVSGELEQGQKARYQLSIPEDGITISLCVKNGRIILYASTTISNPSEAYYDVKLECTDCNSCEFFVDPANFVPEVSEPRVRRKRADDNSTMTVFTNLTLYISMEGVETNNTFDIQSDIGDTTTPVEAPGDDDDFPWILIGAIAGGDVVVILMMFFCVCLCICRLNRSPKIPDVVKSDSQKMGNV